MIARRTMLLLPLLATACGGDGSSAGLFSQPSYSYLTKLRLSVASIEISDRTPPVPTNAVEARAPLRPADGLKQMAQDRLFAGGTTGRAVFVIDAAEVRSAGGGLEGRLAVHLDVYTGGETRVGFAEAQVARRQVGSDSGEPSVLYAFVNQMLDDMNVEFEFQVRRSLKEYLQDTEGAAPPPPPVEQQDLAIPMPGPRVETVPPAHVLTRRP